MEEEFIDALTISENNKYYSKYLQKKDKFLKKHEKKIFSQKHIDDDYVCKEDDYDMNALLYLCYMTRKYLGDCAIFSSLKILFGIVAILISAYLEYHGKSSSIKSLLMAGLLLYGIIQIPLSILISVSCLIAKLRYLNYVSTYTSKVAASIINFYNPETDRFQTVNLKFVVKDQKAFREQRRLRGGL